MKNSLLMLAGAAAFSLASCSQEKTTEVTTAPADGMTTTTTTTTTTGPMTDAQIEARAQQIADKMAANMKITDEATKTKIRTVYVNRYKRMNEMRTKYTADTVGMAAAMRQSMTETDAEFKNVFTDPTQYQAYETSRSTYYGMENEEPAMSSSDMSSGSDMNSTTTTTDASTSTTTTNDGDAMSLGDGGKVKVKADGDIKIKDAQGNKMKVDGDDGTIKGKPKNGGKTKIE